MGRRRVEVFDKVVLVLGIDGLASLHAFHPRPAPVAGRIVRHRRALQEAFVGDGDDGGLVGDEVFDGDFAFVGNDFRQTFVAVLGADLTQFFFDDGEDAQFAGQNVDQIPDGIEQGLVFLLDAFALQSSQLVKAQVEDRVNLTLGELVVPVDEPGLGADQEADLFNDFAAPGQGQKLAACVFAVAGIADDPDEVVQMRERDEEAFEFLGQFFGLA